MLTVENFNQADLQRINALPVSFKVRGLFFTIIIVPACFLVGLFGLTKNGYGYWPSTIRLLIIFTAVAIFSVIKDYFFIYRDRKNQHKYAGIITVIKKSTKKNDHTILTDSLELKKLNLFTTELFDKISVGDKLNIEITRFSKTLLRLEKDNIDLLN